MDMSLKQRLLGAIVLIALAIIFVPMFLSGSGPKQASETSNMQIPVPPEREFQTRVLPVDANQDPAKMQAVPAASGEPMATVDTKAPSRIDARPENGPATSAPTPASARPAPAAAPVPKPPAPAASATPARPAAGEAAGGHYFVHLGIYASGKNAGDLVASLKRAGFPAFAEATQYQGKAAERVRVGPFDDRAAAEAARLRIKQLKPRVPGSVLLLAENAKTDAPAGALPADRAGGWAVQLGAFKTEDDANKLRDRLRNAGFAAFVDKLAAGDQTLWRVRAGPYAARDGADKTRQGIKDKLKLDGIIVTM